jgi:prophage regulatory protein
MATNDNKLLRIGQVLEIVGVKKSTWYDLVKQGKAPKPMRLSHKWSAWDSDEIDNWVSQLKREFSRSA